MREEQLCSYPSQFNSIWKMSQKYCSFEQILGYISQTKNFRCLFFLPKNKCMETYMIPVIKLSLPPTSTILFTVRAAVPQPCSLGKRTESSLSVRNRSQGCSRTTVSWKTERRANQALKLVEAMDSSNMQSLPSTQNLFSASLFEWVCKWHLISVLFLFDHTCNSLKKAFKGLINKVSSLELKFPCIFNVFSCLLAAKCRSQDMWPFITIFSLNVPCLFISCISGEDWYNNLNLTSFFDPVVWAINHKTCTEDWLLVKSRDIETNPKANQSKLKCIERVLKSKIMCLFVILLKERD